MGLYFDLLPNDISRKVVLGAGVLINVSEDGCDSDTKTIATKVKNDPSQILGVTSEGVTFSAVPVLTSFAVELSTRPEWQYTRVEGYTVTLSGMMQTMSSEMSSLLKDVSQSANLLWLGDYGVSTNSIMSIRINNAHSTGGFVMQASDLAPAMFTFSFTAFYDNVGEGNYPFEVKYE